MAKIAELFVGLKFKVEGLAETQNASASLGRVSTSAQQADAHVKLYARNLNAANERHAQLVRGVTRAAAALTAMSLAFGAVARMSVVAASAVNSFVTATGIDGGAFQRMSFEAQQAGVSAGELASQLKGLQTARNEVLLGLRAAPAAWGVLGVSPADTPMAMLEKMRRRIQSFQNTGMARTWALQAGLSEQMFLFLRRSNTEFETLNKNLELTAEQAKTGWELSRAWASFTGTLRAAGVKVLAEFHAPLLAIVKALQPLVERGAAFMLWVLKIPGFGPAVKVALLGLVSALGALAVVLGVLAGILHLAPVWALLTGGSFAAMAAAITPFLPVIALVAAALAALALIVGDVWTYFEGGKSVLGDIIQLLKDVGDMFTVTGDKAEAALERIKGFFKDYAVSSSMLGSAAGPIGDAFGLAGRVGTLLNALDRGTNAAAPVTVTQNNSPTVTVNTSGGDAPDLARTIARDIKGTMDAAYRQLTNYYGGPVENKP